MMHWDRLELMLKTSDLIIKDRLAAGRELGHLPEMRPRMEQMKKDLLAAMKAICRVIDIYTKKD